MTRPGIKSRQRPPGLYVLLTTTSSQLVSQAENRFQAGDSCSQVLHVPGHPFYCGLDGVGSVVDVGELVRGGGELVVEMGGGGDDKDLVLLLLHHTLLLLASLLHTVLQRSTRWLG